MDKCSCGEVEYDNELSNNTTRTLNTQQYARIARVLQECINDKCICPACRFNTSQPEHTDKLCDNCWDYHEFSAIDFTTGEYVELDPCDSWMAERREAPERLNKANERIRQLEAQVSKLEAQLAEAERNAGALKLASDYIADYAGTCPSDMFNLDATEGEIFSSAYCEENCDITTTGKCWEQWFILKQQEAENG